MNTLRALATTLTVILFAVAEGHAGTYRYELFHVDGMLGTFGYGINNDGVVVGGVSYGSNARERSGFIRSAAGELSVVNYPEQVGTQVHGINNLGQSIASYLHPNGAQLSFLIEADGSFTEMQRSEPADINDELQVLGGPYNEIYLWDADGEIEWIAGGDYIFAGGVNNRGLVVSSKEFQEDGFYRWRGRIHDTGAGETLAVDFPGAHDTFVNGINNLDEVIGTW